MRYFGTTDSQGRLGTPTSELTITRWRLGDGEDLRGKGTGTGHPATRPDCANNGHVGLPIAPAEGGTAALPVSRAGSRPQGRRSLRMLAMLPWPTVS
jgi:hypothetical protein